MMSQVKASNPKIYLRSLGCAKNRVDSEHILGLLSENDFTIVESLEEATVAIVNTCGFIQSAVEETIEVIFELAREKERGNLEKLLVTGCFVQRYGYKLPEEIPEVDGWLGAGEYYRVLELLDSSEKVPSPIYIGRPTYLPDHRVPRLQSTPFYSAFLRIAEGCSNRCSYCTIPGIRGPFRSRSPESLTIEAKRLAERGVKEVNLIAQDTTMYGVDLGEEARGLETLLERLVRVKGLAWIRILYSQPKRISDHLLEIMEEEEVICPYLDIPLQHVNEDLLTAMGRPVHGEPPRALLDRIRGRHTPFSIRTSLMVGFPGETEKMFQELYDFVKEVEFDHLGVFPFSPEKGTPAAKLRPLVDEKVAQERLDALMTLQAEISKRKNQNLLGQVIRVLIEGLSPETDLLLTGRTATMAPEVDGRVLINRGKGMVGEFSSVRITEAHAYDLVGEIVGLD